MTSAASSPQPGVGLQPKRCDWLALLVVVSLLVFLLVVVVSLVFLCCFNCVSEVSFLLCFCVFVVIFKKVFLFVCF